VLDAKPIALASYGDAKIRFDALGPMRLAAPFEALRNRSDEILKGTGARPKVFLACLGTAADFTARATFAKNFFETAGIEALEGSLSAAFKESGAALACLCSSDKIYADQALETAKLLQAAGAKHIYLAGRPGEMEAALRAAGVGDFIFAGGDALATLRAAYDKIVGI
jgi:methylmalonyl-CoA mutase